MLISQVISCFPELKIQKLEDKLAESCNYCKTLQIERITDFQTVIELTWCETDKKSVR